MNLDGKENIRVFEANAKRIYLHGELGEREPYDVILQRFLTRLDWIIENYPDVWEASTQGVE